MHSLMTRTDIFGKSSLNYNIMNYDVLHQQSIQYNNMYAGMVGGKNKYFCQLLLNDF